MRHRPWFQLILLVQMVALALIAMRFPEAAMPREGVVVAMILLFATRYRPTFWNGATLTVVIAAWGFFGAKTLLKAHHPWLLLSCLEFMLLDFVLLSHVWMSATVRDRGATTQGVLFVLLCGRASILGLPFLCSVTTLRELQETLSSVRGNWFAIEFMLSALALRAAWEGQLRGARLVLLLGLSFATAPSFVIMADWSSCTQGTMQLCALLFTADLAAVGLEMMLSAFGRGLRRRRRRL
jgi:hypothetical protein